MRGYYSIYNLILGSKLILEPEVLFNGSPTLSWAYESDSIVISRKYFMASYPLFFHTVLLKYRRLNLDE